MGSGCREILVVVESGCHGIWLSWNPVVMESGCHGIRLSWNLVVMESGCHGIWFFLMKTEIVWTAKGDLLSMFVDIMFFK